MNVDEVGTRITRMTRIQGLFIREICAIRVQKPEPQINADEHGWDWYTDSADDTDSTAQYP